MTSVRVFRFFTEMYREPLKKSFSIQNSKKGIALEVTTSLHF
jgi:hypothetical protein